MDWSMEFEVGKQKLHPFSRFLLEPKHMGWSCQGSCRSYIVSGLVEPSVHLLTYPIAADYNDGVALGFQIPPLIDNYLEIGAAPDEIWNEATIKALRARPGSLEEQFYLAIAVEILMRTKFVILFYYLFTLFCLPFNGTASNLFLQLTRSRHCLLSLV